MDAHEDTPRIQVLSVSDTGRRRRWSDDEKIRIVEESFGDAMRYRGLSFMIGVIAIRMDCLVLARNFCAL
ncbi:hypothetical protein ACGYLO_21900 [Sulfitobacter sp. 1A13353]|uniref:hypothetical protein n=1 Tax=Sulfitobacter sp. 1A13353 TaxID=3368568 RepID=UPI0037469A00